MVEYLLSFILWSYILYCLTFRKTFETKFKDQYEHFVTTINFKSIILKNNVITDPKCTLLVSLVIVTAYNT